MNENKTAIEFFAPHEMSFDMQVSLPAFRIDKDSGIIRHSFGDETQTLHAAVVLAGFTHRILWPEKFRVGNQPLCRSHNGVYPVERDPLINTFGAEANGQRVCEDCPMAQWGEEKGERIKPRCALVMSALIIDLETEMPGVLSLARTRLKMAESLTQFWGMTGYRYSAYITTEKVQSPSGTYWLTKFKRGPKFSFEQSQHLRRLRNEVRGWNLAANSQELLLTDVEFEALPDTTD